MGFGWMFLGCFFMFTVNFSGLDLLPDLFGFLLMYHGVKIASEHCECFNLTKRLCSFGIFISLVYTAYQAAFAFKLITVPDMTDGVIYWIYTIFITGYFVSFLLSLAKIATETDVRKIRRRAVVGVLLCAILFFCGRVLHQICVLYKDAMGVELASRLSAGGLIAEIVFVIYLMFTVFSCYMWICLEGDEDMPDNRRRKYVTPFDFYEKDKQKRGGKK